MLKLFFSYFWKYLLSFPAGMAGLFAIIQAGEKTGFDKSSPKNYEKLVNLHNNLLDLAIDQWPFYIITMALAATIWTLIVAEPKTTSKHKFANRRLNHRS